MLRCISSFNPHLDAVTRPLQEPRGRVGLGRANSPGAPALTPDQAERWLCRCSQLVFPGSLLQGTGDFPGGLGILAEVPKLAVLDPTYSKESAGNTMGASDHHPHGREEGCVEGDSQEGIPNRRRSSAQSKGGDCERPGDCETPQGAARDLGGCGRPGRTVRNPRGCETPQGAARDPGGL